MDDDTRKVLEEALALFKAAGLHGDSSVPAPSQFGLNRTDDSGKNVGVSGEDAPWPSQPEFQGSSGGEGASWPPPRPMDGKARTPSRSLGSSQFVIRAIGLIQDLFNGEIEEPEEPEEPEEET